MTQEERDEILISLANDMKKVKERDNLLISLAEDVKQLKENNKLLFSLAEDVKELKKESIRQRENIAELEFRLLDKIGALFDAREINSDKFNEYDKKFKSIDHILGNHNRRILNLESRAN